MLRFLGIGAQKAGTTWLNMLLKQNPDIAFPVIGKEVHFFDVAFGCYPKKPHLNKISQRLDARIEALSRKKARTSRGAHQILSKISHFRRLKDVDYAFTENWYRDLFQFVPENKFAGEITPNYCALPEEGIEKVKEMMPNTAIIYLVRDPYDRALSSLRMMASFGNQTAHDIIGQKEFLARGDYARNIPRWDKRFGNQILYLPFGDIKSRPGKLIEEVENHIGIRRFHGYRDLHKKNNSSADRDHLVDEALRDQLRVIASFQYRFLVSRFGEEFASRIK